MKHYKILLAGVAILAISGGIYLRIHSGKAENNTQPITQNSASTPEITIKPTPSPSFVDLQPLVDGWSQKQTGSASVVVYDLANKKTNASLNPDEQYFTASLYKLFVAYYGYQKVADKTYGMTDPYLADYNRGECLDVMIRNSYSPCGEKMWAELGKDALTQKLKNYGIKNTSMTGLTTTANDSAIILERLFYRSDLNEEFTNLYLDSMLNQPEKFRVGLPSGFTKAKVYNKVGWNENLEWHDASIVTLQNGRSYVVVVLTKSVGRANIVDLAKQIEVALEK